MSPRGLPGFITTQRSMQGDILPIWLKEGISWALAVGLCLPGLPGSCWCNGE